ncbi:uncharacterized protein LOC115974152 [Quercus lobata]|uniref:C2H2-type domain-containing protein n=1 Tax=Quercus lobata TaxID=97700 RepID=A0A7N2KS14_QUELO|nr:uncharacterized protein LOC115974152 [Quercus lobata]
MNLLANSTNTISPSLLFLHKPFLTYPINLNNNPKLSPRRFQTKCSTASTSTSTSNGAVYEIDMVKNKQGVYTPKQKKVVVLWDLDNKPPRGPPYNAAMSLKQLAQRFGDVIDMSAYANRHAFIHLPQWVVQQRRDRKEVDFFERKGLITPSDPYICKVCGRKCKTNLDLKKHFKQLHERERQKKLNRMRSLKGKKRQRFKERFINGNEKYNEAARDLVTPKVGYGLASELRRAGVFVKTVEDKPQAADWALKKQMQHSMSRGVDWLFLVSDDSDFSDMLRRAREAKLGTVVVGDWDRALGRHADLWVPWVRVEKGEVGEKDLLRKEKRTGSEFLDREDELFSVSSLDENVGWNESGLDSLVEEIVGARAEVNGVRISAFDEGEEEDEDGEVDLLWDSEDEDDEYY